MKILAHTQSLKRKGVVSYLAVLTIGIFLIGLVLNTLRSSVATQGVASRSQIKVNYRQQEEAFLSSLVQDVPLSAIQSMMASGVTPANNNWNAIFNRAIRSANVGERIARAGGNGSLRGLAASQAGVPRGQLRSSNRLGNALILADVTAVDPTAASGRSRVNVDTVGIPNLPGLGPARLPSMVWGPDFNYGVYRGQPSNFGVANFPIISSNKIFGAGAGDVLLESPAAGDGRYALMRHPNTKFKYRNDGLLIAKRNWWAFTVNYGANLPASAGVPPLSKDYVVSIYEIPAQTPLSAVGALRTGRTNSNLQSNGNSQWDLSSVSIEAGSSIYADSLKMDGATSSLFGSASSRSGVSFTRGGGLSGLGNSDVSNSVNFGLTAIDGSNITINAAEENYTNSNTNSANFSIDGEENGGSASFGASSSSASNKVAFFPIRSREEQFFRNQLPLGATVQGGGALSLRTPQSGGVTGTAPVSNTEWERYSSLGKTCTLQLVIESFNGVLPASVSLYLYNSRTGRATSLISDMPIITDGGTRDTLVDSNFLKAFDVFAFDHTKLIEDPSLIFEDPDDVEEEDPDEEEENLGVVSADVVEGALVLDLQALSQALNTNPMTNDLGAAGINSISVDYANKPGFANDVLNNKSDPNDLLLILNNDALNDGSMEFELTNLATTYPNGLSIVHNGIVYITANMNTFFPKVPLSIFAKDKRFGDPRISGNDILGLVSSTGGSLEDTSFGSLRSRRQVGATNDPLALRSASTEEVDLSAYAVGGGITLTQKDTAAEIPPVNLIYWMVTVEELTR